MTVAAAPPRTVLEIILDWSNQRLAWQQDALRRIVQAQKLTEGDITALAALCKRGRTDKPTEYDPRPQPLEAAHLPANPGAGASVSLASISDVAAVNNLAPGKPCPSPRAGSPSSTATMAAASRAMPAFSNAPAAPATRR